MAEPSADTSPQDDADEDLFAHDSNGDWNEMAADLRQRRLGREAEAAAAADRADRLAMDEDSDEDSDDEYRRAQGLRRRRQCCMYFAAMVLALLIVGGWQLWAWMHPTPVSCTLEIVRPQKFKIDVSDFFAPKVSAALQLVLKLSNHNMLRSMLLDQCKLTAFDADTGLKLGSTHSQALVLAPFSSTSVTVSLKDLAGALPPPEQRRAAAAFLAKKALLLTIVATATSRIPIKGSKESSVSSNSTRRVDLASMSKEPFFQRAPQPEPEASADTVHDVPT